MGKTYKDEKEIVWGFKPQRAKTRSKSDREIHIEYVRHKKEKRLENALRSCDIDSLINEDFSNI